jgi:hypothetical protein
MVSQTSDGRLTIGDSHEYGLSVDVIDKPFLHLNALPGVHVVTVTNGLGMTMSFGLADRILREAGVVS